MIMSENWAYNLDMLAQNNVINFDAPAYIRGEKPRYVGSPNTMPPDFIPGKMQEQPKKDEFVKPSDDTNAVKNPSWKKWLFGALALGGVALLGWKFKDKLGFNKLKGKFDFDKIKQSCSDKAKVVGDFFKNCWTKIKGWFKPKP